MKQVQESPQQERIETKGAKPNQASVMFVDLFRRVASESQKEKLTNG
jgi:hypothetical protein